MSTGQTHDTQAERDVAGARRPAASEGSHDSAIPAAVAGGNLTKLSPASVSRLQLSAGSRAVSRALGGGALAVQRHAEGKELPTKEEDVAEVSDKQGESEPTGDLGEPAPSGDGAAGPAEETPATESPTEATPTGAESSTNSSTPTAEPTQETPAEPTGSSEESLPAATRTKKEEKKEKKGAKAAGKQFKKDQKLNPGAMSLAAAEQILQGQYGGLKKIVPGTIVILADQPACSAKYDDVCIADNLMNSETGKKWAKGDRAAIDAKLGVTTEGFAWKGVVYVNGKTSLVTATAHEILHNNTASDFRGKVGETFNEGTTEFLARKALKAAGVPVPDVTAYPDQVALTKRLIKFVGEDTLTKAYFGGADSLIKAFEDKSATTWAQLKTDAEALDTVKVKKALKKKKKK